MTVSTHVYSLTVAGSPPVPLRLKGGSVKVDAGQSPRVQASMQVVATPAALDALNPRLSPPPRLTLAVAATFPTMTQNRSFDLTLRSRSAVQADGTVTIVATTDEGLLIDWAPLADDYGAFGYQSSLRGVVNYVLGQVITLRRNLFVSPWTLHDAGVVTLSGELTGSNDNTRLRVTHTAGAGAGGDFLQHPITAMEVGKPHGIRIELQNVSGEPVLWAALMDNWNAVLVLNQSRVGNTIVLTGTYTPAAPMGTTWVHIDVGGPGLGEAFTLALSICEPGVTVAGPYFDGSTDPAGGTKWDGAAQVSPSRWTAALVAPPADDADVTPYWASQNLITDPSDEGAGSIFTPQNCSLDATDSSWAAHGTRSVNAYSPTSTDSSIRVGPQTAGVRAFNVTPGKTYVFSATGRVKVAVGGSADANARRLTVSHQGGVFASSAQLPTTVGTATRVSVEFTVQPWMDTVYFRAWLGHTVGQVQWDAFRLSEKSVHPTDDALYMDGGFADTAGYDYSWTVAANSSTSDRKALIDRPPESLLWKAGVKAIDFLLPIVQAAGYRLVCDERRVWTLRNAEYTAAGVTLIRYGVNMQDGTDEITRDDGDWFDAAVTRYTWRDADGVTHQKVDAYAAQTPYTRVETFEKASPYPGPGFSAYAVARAKGRGRRITAAAVADWRSDADQAMQIVLNGSAEQVGVVQTLTYSLDDDTMAVEGRTADVAIGSIDLLPGTIDGLAGTIDALT